MSKFKGRKSGSILINVIIIVYLIVNMLNILMNENSSRLNKIKLEREVIKNSI